MEEILIISNYYPPEKGAAANRIEQLAVKLHQNNYTVSVICPLANYPKGALFPEYKGKFSASENRDGITVKRLWIYPNNSRNVLKRLLSTLSFSFGVFFYLLFKKTPEKVVVQSPPLLLSFISVFALSFKNKKIILNVSDLWPIAAIELDAMKKGSLSHKFSLRMERYIYKKASLVLGQSNEIIAHVRTFFPNKQCFLYRNYPNHKVEKIALELNEKEPIKIFYAGLLGVAQGVWEMCKKMDLEGLNVEFHIFGDGAEKARIESLIQEQKEKKIFFHGMLERNLLHEKLKSFDIAFVPLKTRIYGSVPSKIFEYSSLGFPIIYFGGGEGEKIMEDHDLGWVIKVKRYDSLNELLKAIGTIQKPDTLPMRNRIFNNSNNLFDLDEQIEGLIEENVF